MCQQLERDSIVPLFLNQYYSALLSEPIALAPLYCYTANGSLVGAVEHQGRDITVISDISECLSAIYTSTAPAASSSLAATHLQPIYSAVSIYKIATTAVPEDSTLSRVHVNGSFSRAGKDEAISAVTFEHNITICCNDQHKLGIISDVLSIVTDVMPAVAAVEREKSPPLQCITNWADHTPELLAKKHEEEDEIPGFHIALPPSTAIEESFITTDMIDVALHTPDEVHCVGEVPESPPSSSSVEIQVPVSPPAEEKEEEMDLSSLTFAERLRLNAGKPKKAVTKTEEPPATSDKPTTNKRNKRSSDGAAEGKRNNSQRKQRHSGDKNGPRTKKENSSSHKKDPSAHTNNDGGNNHTPIATH